MGSQYVLQIVKVNADQGRLGGFLKLRLTDAPRLATFGTQFTPGMVRALLARIKANQDKMQQYQSMLQSTDAPADYIWSQADQTISVLLAARNTTTYYKNQAGSLGKDLERYQDKAHCDSAPSIGSDTCGPWIRCPL